MMLEATELGLGTVWVCYFDPDMIRKEFDLPSHLEPVNIPVSYTHLDVYKRQFLTVCTMLSSLSTFLT